ADKGDAGPGPCGAPEVRKLARAHGLTDEQIRERIARIQDLWRCASEALAARDFSETLRSDHQLLRAQTRCFTIVADGSWTLAQGKANAASEWRRPLYPRNRRPRTIRSCEDLHLSWPTRFRICV